MSCIDASTSQEVLAGLYRGDSFSLRVRLDDVTGQPVDVTGWSWLCQLRSPLDALIGTLDVDTSKAGSGELRLSLAPEVTASLVPGDLVWDLQASDVTGGVRTVLTGKLRIRADVSRLP
jgi:hypothetical protein